MWIASTEGFFSIVAVDYGEHKGDLVVRARAPGDLERLREKIPALSPTELTPLSDYRYRAYITHEEAGEGFGRLVASIDWTNFKDAARSATPEHEKLYHRVWSIMAGLQPGGPYGRGGSFERPIPKKERKADTAARKKQLSLPGFRRSLSGL